MSVENAKVSRKSSFDKQFKQITLIFSSLTTLRQFSCAFKASFWNKNVILSIYINHGHSSATFYSNGLNNVSFLLQMQQRNELNLAKCCRALIYTFAFKLTSLWQILIIQLQLQFTPMLLILPPPSNRFMLTKREVENSSNF